MKKISLLLLLAVTVFFTACQLEKRHYRNGYYVNWNKDRKSTEQLTEKQAQNAIAAVNTTMEAAVLPAETAPVTNESPTVESTPVNNIGTQTTVAPSELQNTTFPVIQETKPVTKAKHNLRQQPAAKSPVRADDDKVLLIILAILLPPLAMYMYEGSWTSRCTLNLILTLLCGLPGMIHALIVIIGDK